MADTTAPLTDHPDFNARLLERIDLHEQLARFRVAPDEGSAPEFKPGQFATLGLPHPPDPETGKPALDRKGNPKLVRRAYSIASPSTTREHLEFYIVEVDDGRLTPSLFNMHPGDRLHMGAKIAGHFTLDPVPDGQHLIMVGTGTGLAPFLSMYETYRDQGRWKSFTLLDGCRLARDLGYLDRLNQYTADDPTFTYAPTVTREPDDSGWAGRRGRVNALLEPDRFKEEFGFMLSPEDCHVFLCGNPAMIDQVEESLIDRGFVVENKEHPDGNLHFERYW
ncbi:MAG: ferredoxin--NADP reductase [Planctomycetota bacterium]